MKATKSVTKNNTQRLIISALMLVLTTSVYSQGNSFDDKYFTVEIFSAVFFVAALGIWMFVVLLKQKNKNNKKVRRHLHLQR